LPRTGSVSVSHSGIVGVVAVGGARGRDDDALDAVRQAGFEQVARAADVDAEFEFAIALLAGRDDGGQMHHHPRLVAADDGIDLGDCGCRRLS
jgi:hypothetical protein